MKIKIEEKIYNVDIAQTEDEREKGLQNVNYLPEDEGMLFIYDEPETVGFWMKDTLIPLDIVFINDDFEVISVAEGIPESEEIHEEKNVKYVLEVNSNSKIQKNDELEFIEDSTPNNKMLVLDENGETQLELDGGERIFSRKNTKTLLKLASRAYSSNKDSDYKKLGSKVFQFLKEQDDREPEHVELNKKSNE